MHDAFLALAWHCQLWFSAYVPDGKAQDSVTLLSFFQYLSSQQWKKQLEKCSIKFTTYCLPALQHIIFCLCTIWINIMDMHIEIPAGNPEFLLSDKPHSVL